MSVPSFDQSTNVGKSPCAKNIKVVSPIARPLRGQVLLLTGHLNPGTFFFKTMNRDGSAKQFTLHSVPWQNNISYPYTNEEWKIFSLLT